MSSDRSSVGRESLADPIDELRKIAGALVDVVSADLSTPVPDCPGWTLRDLVAHLGRVYGAVTMVIDQRATEAVRPGPEAFLDAGLDDDGVRRWFDERIRAIVVALESVSPETELWSWSHERTAAFYRRRMVHESAVHLLDAARALGRFPSIAHEVCVDGIDEFFDVMLPVAIARPTATMPSGSLHLHCTDGPGEWLLVPDGERVVVTREHAKGSTAWRGTALSLLLAVWGRDVTDLDVIGDQAVSAEWSALAP